MQPQVAAIMPESTRDHVPTPLLSPPLHTSEQVMREPTVVFLSSGPTLQQAATIPDIPPTLDKAAASSVNEGVMPLDRATPPKNTSVGSQRPAILVSNLRSPRPGIRVRFEEPEGQAVSSTKYPIEVSLDRLDALQRDTHLHAASPWWTNEEELCKQLFKAQVGEVGTVAAKGHAIDDAANDTLPPPYGAGYVSKPGTSPLDMDDLSAHRVVFKVDSGCEPWTIVSRRLVERAGLVTHKAKTHLRLPDCDTVVKSEDMVDLILKVTLNGRPHLFPMKCVVWERGALHHDMLISQTVAVQTGLSIFVHDNLLREVIMGRQALLKQATHDPPELPEGSVMAIGDEQDPLDEDLFLRISPLDSLREALKAPKQTQDQWVNEELQGPLKEVFGPVPPEPADVPPLEFDLNVEALGQKTYGTTKPTKLPASSPRQFDVLSAQFGELKAAGIMGNAYPEYPPGPIACIAFTVAKPGTKRLPRPASYGCTHPLADDLQKLHEEYTKSLTAERLVVNMAPLNTFTIVQNYPLPSVKDNLAKLSKFKFFAKIDIQKAFWSCPLHPRCIKWTYTIAAGGLTGVWLRAPMGLAPVPGYFMWVLSGVLKGCAAFTLLYADDIIVGGNLPEELRANIRAVLAALLEKGFRVSAAKCQFQPQSSITYLGWTIRDGKISASDSTLKKLFTLRKPVDIVSKDDKPKIQAVRRFLGVIQYLAHYIPCNAVELKPLYELTKTAPPTDRNTTEDPAEAARVMQAKEETRTPKQKARFIWTKAADEAWDWACERLKNIKPLHSPTYSPRSWLEVIADASKFGWGGILIEWREGDPKPYIIACVSGTFTPSQLAWPTCTKEMFGVWSTVRKLRHFLHLHHFVLSTDHRNLLWSSLSANEMVLRMATDLQQHKFVMRHIQGSANVLCDYISRADYSGSEEVQRIRKHSLSTSVQAITTPTALPKGTAPAAPLASELEPQCLTTTEEPSLQSFTTENQFEDSDSAVSTKGLFQMGASSASDGVSSAAQSSESEAGAVPDGHVMPIEPAAQVPMLPRERGGDPPARQRRRHRHQRQPAPPLDWQPEGADDGGAIPHMHPQPVPRPRRLSPEQYHILKSFHGGALPHTGVTPLLTALREAGHRWEGIHEDVAEFVARCHYCQLERIIRRGPSSLPYTSVQIPSTLCETWHFDVLGPLPPCALTGATFVLAAMEDTSKLLMLGRSVDCAVLELMLFFLDCFKIFGVPHTIKTDKMSQYVSKATKELCECMGIRHEIGIAHYHQSDGVIENGAALIWPYLRIMCAELRRFHAWSPLLCNVQLGANALNREVLGGASASEIMFNRKVRPLRFLQPETLVRASNNAPPVEISRFIADQAAMQLRLLGNADAEQHRRFRNQYDQAEQDRDGAEHLDWVRTGILVSIPQPDADQHFNRPNKFALLRRGPFEVLEVRTRTVTLQDYHRARAGRNPPTFQWPKFNLAPYFSQGDIAPGDNAPAPYIPDAERDQVQIFVPPPLPGAILRAIPIDRPVIPNSPAHVRNQQYEVRWMDRPHSANSIVNYDDVWSSPAFQEFVSGSEFVGHVPPQQFAQEHARQVQALAYGGAQPNVVVPMANAQVQAEIVRNYIPSSNVQRRIQPHGIARASALPPLQNSQSQQSQNATP